MRRLKLRIVVSFTRLARAMFATRRPALGFGELG